MEEHEELGQIVGRYARRVDDGRYSMLRTEVYLAHQERFASFIRILRRSFAIPPSQLMLVDVGCGTGGNLLDFLRIGFRPEHLVGLELLEQRVSEARRLLPSDVKIIGGDASAANIASESIDVVFQSVVFSSLLSDDFQRELAHQMWRWVRPGGGVLWYDFVYDNPRNPDVRGVSNHRIRKLFPEAHIKFRKVTLAPPLARATGKIGAPLHNLLHCFPFLRTHTIAWIKK